ncbi:MAG: protein kinase [Acidobacteria bacterium]|nr:protein kinase [Acidobacteriota bacterium]
MGRCPEIGRGQALDAAHIGVEIEERSRGTLLKSTIRRRSYDLLILVLLSIAWAAPLRGAQWYDEYYDGIRALGNHEAAKATSCFQRAIKKRPDPGEHLLTYGTNSIEHYHPYLRLAEAQVMLGQLDAARGTLLQSVAIGKEPAPERHRIVALIAQAENTAIASRQAATQTQKSVSAVKAVAEERPAPPPAEPPRQQVESSTLGILVIESTPSDATVLLSGRYLGTTPLEVKLSAGTYRFLIRSSGMEDDSFTARVRARERIRQHRVLVPSTKPLPADGVNAPQTREPIRAVFISVPPGATVYLDDEPIGVTGMTTGRLILRDVQPGLHRLRMSLSEHQEYSDLVTVIPGEPNLFPVTLPPLPTDARDRTGVYVSTLVVAALACLLLLLGRRALRRGGTQSTLIELPSETSPAPPTRVVGAPLAGGSTPEVFGEYRLLEVLGKGGMAIVYKADKRGELFAIKRPLPAVMDEPNYVARFLREAEIGRTLHHPNIIRVVDHGAVNGVPYFAMELIDGETLRALLSREETLEPRRAAEIIGHVAEALDYAHLKGVIHRDLKPSNIMLSERLGVKVMDYGIARALRFEPLTTERFFLGTAHYVSPEVIEGRPSDGRSDLFALGVIFCEMLTGDRPWASDSSGLSPNGGDGSRPLEAGEILRSCPAPLDNIISKLLRRRPDERYQSAAELAMDLRAYLSSHMT